MARTELTNFEKEIRAKISKNLKRLSRGLTQTQIADKTDILTMFTLINISETYAYQCLLK